MATSPPVEPQMLCCFCGDSIAWATPDPLVIAIRPWDPTGSGKEQTWFSHAKCLKERLYNEPVIFNPRFF